MDWRAARGESATTVSQVVPSRRPTTICGTTATEWPGCGSKAKNATGPLPGRLTWSSMSASAIHRAHQRCAREKRSEPLNSARAASPQPTSPASSPLSSVVTHDVVRAPRGSSESSGRAASASDSTTVRTVAGGEGTAWGAVDTGSG